MTGETVMTLTFRSPDPSRYERDRRVPVPPFDGRPCPDARDALAVEIHAISGPISTVGPGNLIQPNLESGPVRLQDMTLGAEEAAVLIPFFGARELTVLSGRTPPVLSVCDPSTCRAAFRHASTIVTLMWTPRPDPLLPSAIVDRISTNLWAWTDRHPPRPPVLSPALRSEVEDALASAIRKGDLRPLAYPSVGPEGNWYWLAAGFSCEEPRPDYRRIARSLGERLDRDVFPYVHAYNQSLVDHTGCPVRTDGIDSVGSGSFYGDDPYSAEPRESD